MDANLYLSSDVANYKLMKSGNGCYETAAAIYEGTQLAIF